MAPRYPVGANLKSMCTLLDVAPERVLRRADLSPALAMDDEFLADATTYFRLWDALYAEANRPGFEIDLALAYAHGPFIPPIFAFSCAETLGLGLARLSDFKPLIAPCEMTVARQDTTLTVSMRSTEIGFSISPNLGLLEILYITECARTFTGTSVTPIETSLPGPHQLDARCLDYLGKAPKITGTVGLTFTAQDADLPLITRSASLWETLKPGFLQQLEDRTGTATLSGQVKHALTEALPGGSTSVETMARRLNLSKRSLQRRLGEEGTSFQKLLDATRFEMSDRYLKDTDLSVPEISYLLGFRETSSFFRAVRGWTGTPPGDYRAARTKDH